MISDRNKDLTEKPGKYAEMGVQEYFAYDPYDVSLPASKKWRLFGWRLDQASRTMKEISPRPDGSLWSHHLQSWLVPDGAMLRLHDSHGQMRLTYGEAEARQRQIEAQRAEVAIQQAEYEAMRAQTEARRADAAIQQAEMFAEKLRSLGIDPDQLI